jgi:hypothetical protein
MINKQILTLRNGKLDHEYDSYYTQAGEEALCWESVWALMGIYPGPNHRNLPAKIEVEWSANSFKGSRYMPLRTEFGVAFRTKQIENLPGASFYHYAGKMLAGLKGVYFKMSLTQ